MELLVAGVGYGWDTAGGWEGECRPGTEAISDSETQGDEGEWSLAQFEVLCQCR